MGGGSLWNTLKCKQIASTVKCPCEQPNMVKSLSISFYYVTILVQTFTHQTEKLLAFGDWQVLNLDQNFMHCAFTYLNHLPINGAFSCFSCISITAVWWNATYIFHQAAVYTRYVTACVFSLCSSYVQLTLKHQERHFTQGLCPKINNSSHSSWIILRNIWDVLCFTKSTRAQTILQSPGCVIETHWPTVTLCPSWVLACQDMFSHMLSEM